MLAQLFFLLLMTCLFNILIIVSSGGIVPASPTVITCDPADPLAIHRAVQRGASPVWLHCCKYPMKELMIIQRKIPWIFCWNGITIER